MEFTRISENQFNDMKRKRSRGGRLPSEEMQVIKEARNGECFKFQYDKQDDFSAACTRIRAAQFKSKKNKREYTLNIYHISKELAIYVQKIGQEAEVSE